MFGRMCIVTRKSSPGPDQEGDLQEPRFHRVVCPEDQDQHLLLLCLHYHDNSADGNLYLDCGSGPLEGQRNQVMEI